MQGSTIFIFHKASSIMELFDHIIVLLILKEYITVVQNSYGFESVPLICVVRWKTEVFCYNTSTKVQAI